MAKSRLRFAASRGNAKMTRIRKQWLGFGLAGPVLAGLILAPGAAQAKVPQPTGNWIRTSGTVEIAVSRCGSHYCAVNTWVKRPDGPEKKGDRMILTVRPVSSDEFKGTAYDVRRHLTYRMTILFEGDIMKTSGCILLGIVCRSTSWIRVASNGQG